MLEPLLQLGDGGLIPVAILGVFLLVGLGFVAYGVANLRTYLQLRSMTPTDAHAVGSGMVEVEGEAAVGERTVEAPFTGEDCLAYEFEVEEYHHDDDGSNWRTEVEGTETVPFRIEDGTGQVGVVPTESSLSVERDYRIDVGRSEQPPERVREFLAGRSDLDHDTGSFDLGPVSIGTGDRRRFTERRLDPGTTAYVAGRAKPTTAVDGASPTVTGSDDGGVLARALGAPFVVADAGEGEAQRRYLKLGVGTLLFGALFASIPLFFFSQLLIG
ncbi:GIDE domain-containing protein [Halorubellus sp. PRR65]|uniref:GIDE domain-containing protein n=1 Tax=Halorubellus sp. PRR65 TaxID=3098148 RepID=UPI002B25D5DD|nr:GIDE domain-containing protein [Halorubellus sp. PRR65]